jgi:hypothetical protein
MSVKQISVFLENKPGTLESVTTTLNENGINIRALCLADAADYGVLRMIVDDDEKAAAILTDNGYLLKTNNILAVSVADAPGGLSHVIHILAENKMNVEYLYVFVRDEEKDACAVLRVHDTANAESVLLSNGIKVIDSI